MRAPKAYRFYRRKMKKIVRPSEGMLGKAKQMNLKMIKVCFGPCRCFSAAKR